MKFVYHHTVKNMIRHAKMKNEEYIQKLKDKIKELNKINPIEVRHESLTFLQKASDICCAFLGSWKNIFWTTLITFMWMYYHPFHDVFPYCLYTLIISVVALYGNSLLQMSNNRDLERDRWHNQLDADTNTRSELSLILLHQKIDSLIDYLNTKKGN